jgi:hypothetical protein
MPDSGEGTGQEIRGFSPRPDEIDVPVGTKLTFLSGRKGELAATPDEPLTLPVSALGAHESPR